MCEESVPRINYKLFNETQIRLNKIFTIIKEKLQSYYKRLNNRLKPYE